VEPRNTPTTINVVFNFANFFDGRAHNQFNGVSVIGPLDENAKIWVADAFGNLSQVAVLIPNSSLASQAVGPPQSDLEMSFFNPTRPFPLIGRKLLSLTPLGLQMVDTRDSVLGNFSRARQGQPGINLAYATMIQQAFRSQYWDSDQLTAEEYTLMEANFSLFFGLAVQMYESTLISDQTPFDRFMAGDDDALDQEQLQGLVVFLNRGARGNFPEVDAAIAAAEAVFGVEIGAGNCVSCHGGPELTDASVASVEDEPIEVEETTELVGGFLQIADATAFIDNGFANIGVRPIAEDLGRGGEEGGFPLSFARQALLELGFAPELELDECGDECPVDDRVGVDGAFKIPGLRNVELTGPYFHNGGKATLGQVVEFYDRQGDFSDKNVANLERNMAFIALDEEDEEPLIEFLLALTDERVRQDMAPFDHPQLLIPDGGTFASPVTFNVPAVGAGGRPAAGLPPLGTFLGLDPD
jgi:cytochrome c peroxidase